MSTLIGLAIIQARPVTHCLFPKEGGYQYTGSRAFAYEKLVYFYDPGGFQWQNSKHGVVKSPKKQRTIPAIPNETNLYYVWL